MGSSPSHSEYSPPKNWTAVCAIDVGSVQCDYSYGFQNCRFIWKNGNWAEDKGYTSYRCPSAILYIHKKPVKFGFEACDVFLSEKDILGLDFQYEGLLSPQSIPEAGQKWRADIAVLLALHFRDQMEKNYKRVPTCIEYILVVPSHWKDNETDIYKKEFNKGLEEITKEVKVSAVTAVDCLDHHFKTVLRTKGHVVAVHTGAERCEVYHNLKQKSLDLPGNGANQINIEFEESLRKIFETNNCNIDNIKEAFCGRAWLEFLLKFEHHKRSVTCDENDGMVIDVNMSLNNAYEGATGQHLSHHSDSTDPIRFTDSGKLIILSEEVENMFNKVEKQIEDEIDGLNDKSEKFKIIVSGGLSTYLSQYFQKNELSKSIELIPSAITQHAVALTLDKNTLFEKLKESLREVTPIKTNKSIFF